MRKVSPGIQIILSISEGLSQIATSVVTLAAGCAVIKALPPPIIDMHLSGNRLRRRIPERYWTVVQHRDGSVRSPSVALLWRSARQALPSGPMSCRLFFFHNTTQICDPSGRPYRSEHPQPVHTAE